MQGARHLPQARITPVAGDNVTLSDDGTMIDEILPRKNVFIRPPIANLDILFIVTSTTQPVPSTLVLDQLAAAAIYKDVQPRACCDKI